MKTRIVKRIKAVREALGNQRGFTLIEIMIVVTIIALLSALVSTQVFKQLKKAKVTTAQVQIKNFQMPLFEYNTLHGNFPSTDEGLQALVNEKLIRTIPKDPWGNEYIYRYPSENAEDDYEIISYGADGKPGGESFNKDISNIEATGEEQ